jgi:hypothetical protein
LRQCGRRKAVFLNPQNPNPEGGTQCLPKTLPGRIERRAHRPRAATRQRGVTPSRSSCRSSAAKELVKKFKSAVHRDMKLNQLLEHIFEEFLKHEKA